MASGLLGRAFDRLDEGDPARADLALDWCEALLAVGDVTQRLLEVNHVPGKGRLT